MAKLPKSLSALPAELDRWAVWRLEKDQSSKIKAKKAINAGQKLK